MRGREREGGMAERENKRGREYVCVCVSECVRACVFVCK